MKKVGIFCVLIACLVVVTINAGCVNQPTPGPKTVAGTSGLQVQIEKNVTVNQVKYKEFETGKMVISPPIARFSLNIIFSNTGASPVNLENNMYKLYWFDPKYNAYQEHFSGTGIGLGFTTLQPGSSTQSSKLNTYIGATQQGWCNQKEQYKFEIKKGGVDTIYSTEFTILPSDCDDVQNYHNGNMDPNNYRQYIDNLKTNPANR